MKLNLLKQNSIQIKQNSILLYFYLCYNVRILNPHNFRNMRQRQISPIFLESSRRGESNKVWLNTNFFGVWIRKCSLFNKSDSPISLISPGPIAENLAIIRWL